MAGDGGVDDGGAEAGQPWAGEEPAGGGSADRATGTRRTGRTGWMVWVAGALAASLVASLLVARLAGDDGGPTGPASGSRDPGAPADLVAVRHGLVVTLVRPGGGDARATVGMPVPLLVEAVAGSPVVEVQLWGGATVLGERATGGTVVREHLTWVPSSVGTVVLFARAVDGEGRAAQSNAVRVVVDDLVAPVTFADIAAGPADTLTSIATDRGVPVDEVRAVNPGVDPAAVLPVGTEVVVPLVDPAGVGPLDADDLFGAAGGEGGGAANGGGPGADTTLAPPAPGAPTVVVDAHDCTAELHVAGADKGFVVEKLGPTASVFHPVADVGAPAAIGSEGVWTQAMTPGRHWFVVGAKVDGGLRMSLPVEVVAGDQCGGVWSGDVRLVDGLLTGGKPASAAYAYLSTDGTHWVRVPDADGASVPSIGAGFDLHEHLPALSGGQLDVRAWGWQDGVLVEVGSGHFTASPGVALNDVIGSPRSAQLDIVPGGGSAKPVREVHLDKAGRVDLRWSTALTGVTHGLWQVTSIRPTGDRWLDPAGLVAQGTVPGNGGDFAVDLGPVADVPATLTLGTVTPAYQAMAPAALGGAVSPSSTSTSTTVAAGPTGSGTAVLQPEILSGTKGLVVAPAQVRLPRPTQFWIRVVAMSGDQPAGLVTNTVVVDTAPSTGAPADPDAKPYLLSATLDPPAAPNLLYARCFELRGWDPDKVDAGAFAVAAKYRQDPGGAFKAVSEGGTNAFSYWIYQRLVDSYGQDVPICAKCYGGVGIALGGAECSSDSSLLEDFVSALGDLAAFVWDEVIVAGFYAVKDFVVDTLVTLSGCEAIASEIGGDDGKAACGVIAEAAVDAVLMAYGIPPNLPTTGELIDAAKGDLETLVVELAQSYGVPCDELGDVSDATGEDVSCEAAAAELLDEMEGLLEDSYAKQAPSTTGLSFPPGARVVPYPAGQVQPARFDVTLTPNPAAGDVAPMDCAVHTTLQSQWDTGKALAGIPVVPVSVPGMKGQFTNSGVILEVATAPRTFVGWPFAFGHREVRADPAGPVHATYYLFQPSLLDPVPVTYLIDEFFGGFLGKEETSVETGTLPAQLFLLHEGAVHTAVLVDGCSGVTHLVADTGGPGPQQ